MNISENKSYCILPWINISVDPDGTIKPCCVSQQYIRKEDGTKYNLGYDTLPEIINSTEYVQLRQDMIDGKKVPGCNECYQQEQYGGRSLRINHSEHWQILPSAKAKFDNPTSVIPIGVEYFDLRFGNLCNLMCQSCRPENSSQLAKENKQLGFPVHVADNINDWYQTETFIENIKSQIDNIKSLYITGGEPTLIEKNYEILEYLINEGKAKEIFLQLNTNLTNIKPRFLNLIKQFKYVTLFISIDGYGPVQEYIRYPSNWNQIDKNIRLLLELHTSNIDIRATPVIQMTNLSTIVDLFEYFEKFNRELGKPAIVLNPIILYSPLHFDIRFLPIDYKQKCWEKIEQWLPTAQFQSDELKSILEQVKQKCQADDPDSEEWLRNFKTHTDIIDNHRQLYLKDVNPELYQIVTK